MGPELNIECWCEIMGNLNLIVVVVVHDIHVVRI